MYKYKKVRGMVCIILTFFLSVCWFGLIFCIQARTGILSEQNLKKSLRDSGYMTEAWKVLDEAMTGLLKENGIQLVTEDILDENQAYLYLTNYIDSVFKEKMDDGAVLAFEEGMRLQLEEYLKEYGVKLTPAAEQSLKGTVKEAGSNVKRYIFPDFILQFYNFYSLYRKFVIKGCIACGAGILAISILLLLLYRHKHKAMRYITCSVFGAVLCNLCSLILLWSGKIPEEMVTGPAYYEEFLKLYVANSVQQCYIITGILGCIGLAGISAVKALKHRTG